MLGRLGEGSARRSERPSRVGGRQGRERGSSASPVPAESSPGTPPAPAAPPRALRSEGLPCCRGPCPQPGSLPGERRWRAPELGKAAGTTGPFWLLRCCPARLGRLLPPLVGGFGGVGGLGFFLFFPLGDTPHTPPPPPAPVCPCGCPGAAPRNAPANRAPPAPAFAVAESGPLAGKERAKGKDKKLPYSLFFFLNYLFNVEFCLHLSCGLLELPSKRKAAGVPSVSESVGQRF